VPAAKRSQALPGASVVSRVTFSEIGSSDFAAEMCRLSAKGAVNEPTCFSPEPHSGLRVFGGPFVYPLLSLGVSGVPPWGRSGCL